MALTRITRGVIKPNENYDTHNIVSTGIVTSVGLDVNGNADVSGSLSVGGVLTYEDVTSIDSIGIITARSGIDADDFISVGNNIHLGNAGVITATSFVGSGAALTGIDATSIKDSGGNVKIQAQASGAIHSGVSTFQDIDVDGHTNLDNVSIAGITTVALNQELVFGSNADSQLTGRIKQLSGSSPSMQITSRYPRINALDFRIHHIGNNQHYAYFWSTEVALFHQGNKKFSTTGGGIDVTGNTVADGLVIDGNSDLNGDLDVDGHTNLDNVSIAGVTTFASGNVQLASDSQRLQLGSGQDLWMYHTGTSGGGHGLIQNDYGTMYMLSDSFIFRDRSTNHNVFQISENNSVSLYYQNSAKLSTTSIGAQIDTTLRLYGAAGTGGGRLRLAEGAAYSEIRGVRNTDTSSELWFGTEIGDTVDYRAKINTGGHFIPGTDSTYDLGLTGTRWRNVYADTLYGDGSNLTGIAADKIFEGNTEVETVDTGSDGTIKFTTEGSERARITSGGAFLVGATSSAGARAIIQQNSSDTNPLDQQTCADSSGLRIQNYSFGVGRYSALSLECANASSVQSASIVAQSVSSGTSPDIIITQRTSNSVNTERLRIQSDGTVIFANKLTNSSSYTTHNANFYGGNTNTGGVRIEVAHNNTTVSGNTAQGSFPHHLNLTNYSGSGSADNRMVTIGFDIPTTSTHANGAIAYQATGAGQGDFSFWTETGNAIYERLRIASDGQVLPGADDAQNLGSSTKRWANIYAADMHFSNEGKTNDVDGTWGDWTLQEGEDSIYMINNRTGKKYSITMKEVN